MRRNGKSCRYLGMIYLPSDPKKGLIVNDQSGNTICRLWPREGTLKLKETGLLKVKKRIRHEILPESESGKCVLRILNGIQGDKSIGRKWYLLLKKLLENFGFKCCHTEPSAFVYEDVYFILNTSTDDFLCAHLNQQIYDDLCNTEHGVSYDQTEHIEHKIFKKYFSDWKVAKSGLKAVHTPFRTDSQYEMNLVK
eukprot:scaffold23804_cov48-Cyclotella_meneghiniana.AAC.2